MSGCTYTWPITYVPKSNGTYAVKKQFTLRACVASFTQPELWNCNLCGSDEEYFNPIIEGDKIYLQWIVSNLNYSHILLEAVNVETEEVLPSPNLEYAYGKDKNLQGYVSASFDINDYPVDVTCIYFRAKFFKCTLNPDVLLACLDGDSSYESFNRCYTELCAQFDYVRTEPYRRAGCQENTVLIEGYYKTYDCNNNFYGPFDTLILGNISDNNFKPSVRILAELFKNGFAYDKTMLNTKVVGITNRQVFKLRSHKVPPYVADLVNLCFASRNLYLDSEEYVSGTQIDKGFDEGRMWIIDVNVTKECRQDNLTCD